MGSEKKPASLEVADLFGVKGLIAVVTGGGTGIGLMIAQALETNGAIVYITGRRKEVLDKAVKTAKHGNLFAIQADVTKKSSLGRAAAEIKTKHGFVNVVVANAGIQGPLLNLPSGKLSISEMQKHLCSVLSDDFTSTFHVNVTGVYNTVAEFLELLDQGNRRGNVPQRSQVVAISSIAAYSRTTQFGYNYGPSKAAVEHMMRQFATSLAPYGIRSNVIAPGPYPSEMADTFLKQIERNGGWKRDRNPMERAGDVRDMAGAALFLFSRAGAYINNNVIISDGGMLALGP